MDAVGVGSRVPPLIEDVEESSALAAFEDADGPASHHETAAQEKPFDARPRPRAHGMVEEESSTRLLVVLLGQPVEEIMHASGFSCLQCRNGFQVPPMVRQAGGAVACPHCGFQNIIAAPVYPAAGVVPPSPTQTGTAKPSSSGAGAALAVIIGIFVGLWVVTSYPVVGFMLGAVVLGMSVAWAASKKARATITRVLKMSALPTWKRVLLCAAGMLGGLTLFALAYGGLQAEARDAEKEAERQAALKARAAEKAAQEAARHQQQLDLVASARGELKAGKLDAAQAKLVEAKKLGSSEEVTSLSEDVASAVHQAEIDAMPADFSALQGLIEDEAWEPASKECTRMLRLDGDFAGLKVACEGVAAGKRAVAVPQWIEAANAVADDKNKCTLPIEIEAAWVDLKKITPKDSQFSKAKRAAARLERCRKKAKKAFTKSVKEVMAMQRRNHATNLEETLLELRMNAEVSTRGKWDQTLRIKWALMTRVTVRDFTGNDDLVGTWTKVGFTKVIFTDGFYESWTVELDPESEDDAGAAVLGDALQNPLKLE